MTSDSVPQSLNVRCPACRNRFPAEAPAWGRTVPCPQCGSPCDVPVPLGVDIAPQWMSAEEKAASARRSEPVLDVGLKADSSDGIPVVRPQKRPAPGGSPGVAWSGTGPASRPAPDGRGARRSPGSPTSDIDENDLIDDDRDDDDLLAGIAAGARQAKYAPKTRDPNRRKKPRRDPNLTESGYQSPDTRYTADESERANGSWDIREMPLVYGPLLMVGAAVWFVLGLSAGRIYFYPPVMFVIGAGITIKGLAG